ncbi:glycosyltransferase family 4 protein [Lutimonas zeaxanthinifaciens]|uniref:glycosyltransferase family 4 protein n=1 Tax=Lutimonas zeaxanthinifaciens TaxID=3060215 RepID=UPI00265CF5E9|nr:glycosyltransferase family 4 protein [Lutimonas sp. YSD2104]WKK66462.1 glycosyltransferase family 4 protein [Lutimonas sp. YSD2104]
MVCGTNNEKSKMKILWFANTPCSASEKLTSSLNRGGWLSALEYELSKKENLELHVAFYYSESTDPFLHNNVWFYPIVRKNSSSKIQRYKARLFKQNYDIDEIQELNRILNQVNPDLIHVHGTEENFGLIQYHTSIPVVISIQGILSPIVEKFFSGIPFYLTRKYNSLKSKILLKSGKYDFQKLSKDSIREREILRICKNIIGRTDWDKRVTRILAPNSNYFVGQEMLRPSFYENTWQKKRVEKKIRIITVMSNSVYKGFECIVKTANILSKYPGFDFEWQVIGLNIKSEIVFLTQEWLKINPENVDIRLFGEKNETEIVDLLLSADIYCQVSHIENSPNSLCEAMILGLPAIASFAGGTNSILENGKEGTLVQDGDPYSFAGAIQELSEDFEKSSLYSKNAQKRANKRHDKQRIIMDLIKTYHTIINQSLYDA